MKRKRVPGESPKAAAGEEGAPRNPKRAETFFGERKEGEMRDRPVTPTAMEHDIAPPAEHKLFKLHHVYEFDPKQFPREKFKKDSILQFTLFPLGIRFPPPKTEIPAHIEKAPVYQAFEKAFWEAVKNWIDAGASKILLHMEEFEGGHLLIQIQDNGEGFPEQLIGKNELNKDIDYRRFAKEEKATSRLIGIESEKYAIRHEKFGGAGKGLAGLCLLLEENGGHLFIKNVPSTSATKQSAVISLYGPLVTPKPNLSPR